MSNPAAKMGLRRPCYGWFRIAMTAFAASFLTEAQDRSAEDPAR